MLHHLIVSLFSHLSLTDVSHALPLLLATAPVAVPAGDSGAGDGGDEPSSSSDFKAVGDAILAGMSEEERNRPFGESGDDDGEGDEPEGTAKPPAKVAKVTKPAAEEAAAGEDDDDEEEVDLEGRAPVEEVAGDDDEEEEAAGGEEDEGARASLRPSRSRCLVSPSAAKRTSTSKSMTRPSPIVSAA
jgi:hypothetical protein